MNEPTKKHGRGRSSKNADAPAEKRVKTTKAAKQSRGFSSNGNVNGTPNENEHRPASSGSRRRSSSSDGFGYGTLENGNENETLDEMDAGTLNRRAPKGPGRRSSSSNSSESNPATFLIAGHGEQQMEVKYSDRFLDLEPDGDYDLSARKWLASDQKDLEENENPYPDGAIPKLAKGVWENRCCDATEDAWNVSPYEAIPCQYNLNWTPDIFKSIRKLALTIVFRNNLPLFQQAIQYALDIDHSYTPTPYQCAVLPEEFSTLMNDLENREIALEDRDEKFRPFFEQIDSRVWSHLLSDTYFPQIKLSKFKKNKQNEDDFDPLLITKSVLERIENAYDKMAMEKGLATIDDLYTRVKPKAAPRGRGAPNSDGKTTLFLSREVELRKRWQRRHAFEAAQQEADADNRLRTPSE